MPLLAVLANPNAPSLEAVVRRSHRNARRGTAAARFGPCPKGKVRSRKGKCVKPLPTPKKGRLYGWKKTLPAARRRQILLKGVMKDGYATIVRRLNLLVNISSDQPTRMIARQDMVWMHDHEAEIKAARRRKVAANPRRRRVRDNNPLLYGAAAGVAGTLASHVVGRHLRNPRDERVIDLPFKKGRKYSVAQVDKWVRQNGTAQMVKRWDMALAQYKKFHLGSLPNYITYGVQNIGSHKGVVDVEFGVSEGKEWMASYQVPKTSKKWDGKNSDGRFVHAHGDSGIDVDVKRPVRKSKLPDRFHTPDGKFVGVIPSKNVKIDDWYRG
jgi:hypothetical protein